MKKKIVYGVVLVYFIIRWLIHKRNPNIASFYINILIMIIIFEVFIQNPTIFSIDYRHALRLRFSSMVIYLIHPMIIGVVQNIIKLSDALYIYLVTLIISVTISFFIYDLKEIIKNSLFYKNN